MLIPSRDREAAVDLAELAGCRPIGVLCEILNDDGTMARLPQLLKFAGKHKLKICTIEDLIEFRRTGEKLVEKIEVVKLPTDFRAGACEGTSSGRICREPPERQPYRYSDVATHTPASSCQITSESVLGLFARFYTRRE